MDNLELGLKMDQGKQQVGYLDMVQFCLFSSQQIMENLVLIESGKSFSVSNLYLYKASSSQGFLSFSEFPVVCDRIPVAGPALAA